MTKKYSLRDEMSRMQEQIDSMFDRFVGFDPFLKSSNELLEAPTSSKKLMSSNYKEPASDIYETDKEVIVELEVPGIDKKDIKISVDEEGIEVKAELETEKKNEDKKKGRYKFERNYSGYYRYFSLPKNVDVAKAVAENKNGVLKISVPKSTKTLEKKRFLEIK